MPAISHLPADCVSEVGVKPHSGREGKGEICGQPHHEACDERSQSSRCEDRARVHACVSQHIGVDGKDVSHCRKSRDPRDDLSFHIRMVLFELKQFFHKRYPL